MTRNSLFVVQGFFRTPRFMGSIFESGESLGKLLFEALGRFEERFEDNEYAQYRARAILYRLKRRHLPANEAEDPRNFELRASGIDPENPSHCPETIREASDRSRRDLVTFSRKARVRFHRQPDQNNPVVK